MVIAAAAITLALALPGAASAYTVDDIRALGYEIGIQFQTETCTAWWVSGFGVSTSLGCEGTTSFQEAVDSIANPNGHYERRWQYEHPEEFQAAQTLIDHCYSVNRTAPMTDSWRIVGGDTDLTVPGADVPSLAATLLDLGLADGSCPAGTGGSTIMPNTNGDGSIVFPGSEAAIESAEQEAADSWAAYAEKLAADGYDVGGLTLYGVEIRPRVGSRCVAV